MEISDFVLLDELQHALQIEFWHHNGFCSEKQSKVENEKQGINVEEWKNTNENIVWCCVVFTSSNLHNVGNQIVVAENDSFGKTCNEKFSGEESRFLFYPLLCEKLFENLWFRWNRESQRCLVGD